MRHLKKRKLKIGYDASRRTMKSLCAALILHERIVVTAARGKLVKSEVEKLITKGKRADLHKKRQLFSALPDNAAKKVFEVLGPKYLDRSGGYLRMTKTGRTKDGTAKVQLEFV